MKQRLFWSTVLAILLIALLAAPASAQGDRVYIVQPGDSLTHIAARHGLTATQLATANGLRWDAWVYTGQRLRIPGTGSNTGSSGAPAAGGTYVVQRGDSLSSIAGRHGVTVAQLAAANNLQSNAWVYAGQRLQIPGQGATGATTSAPTAEPEGTTGGTYIVRPGDTLLRIAMGHGLTVQRLAMANGMHVNAWVYIGQQLKIPTQESGATSASGATSSSGSSRAPTAASTYVVRPGDTLIGIAVRHGVSVQQLAVANGIQTTAWVYIGHRLKIPSPSSGPGNAGQQTARPSQPTPTPQPTLTPPPMPTPRPMPTPQPGSAGEDGEKWIDVNLTEQTVTAYVGQQAVFHAIVSTGTSRTPTVVGTYRIYSKYVSTPMSGPGYYLPNVPHAMFFYRGYSFHGTYWHNNFGTPMSHGCVNMTKADAKWLYEWTPIGTRVVTHH